MGKHEGKRLLCEDIDYLLTPWCRVLLEKPTGLQLVKKYPAFYGTRRFITTLTSIRHLSLSWASPILSTYPHPTSWRSILILSTHLRLGLPTGLFPSGFPTKTLYTPFSSPIRATCLAHLILLDFITLTILSEEYLPNYMHKYIVHTYIYTYIHDMRTYICTFIHKYIHIYIHSYKPTCIYLITYEHIYISVRIYVYLYILRYTYRVCMFLCRVISRNRS